ncbi:MAG TPA: DUF2252 family protein, partial [Acidimicrobiales bacterium]
MFSPMPDDGVEPDLGDHLAGIWAAGAVEPGAEGRGLRHTLPRRDHSHWFRPAWLDPLSILESTNARREPDLIPIRRGRMAASPFAYFRGAAAVMAADLAATPSTGIDVQLCGDAHVANFGVYAAPDHRLVFDLTDFDESSVGPWEWDVKRLAASAVVASVDQGRGLPTGRKVARAAVNGYRAGVRSGA